MNIYLNYYSPTCVVVEVDDYSFHPGIVCIPRIVYIACIELGEEEEDEGGGRMREKTMNEVNAYTWTS